MILRFELPDDSRASGAPSLSCVADEAPEHGMSAAYFWMQLREFAEQKCQVIRDAFRSDVDERARGELISFETANELPPYSGGSPFDAA